jgi:hypothetical protein
MQEDQAQTVFFSAGRHDFDIKQRSRRYALSVWKSFEIQTSISKALASISMVEGKDLQMATTL